MKQVTAIEITQNNIWLAPVFVGESFDEGRVKEGYIPIDPSKPHTKPDNGILMKRGTCCCVTAAEEWVPAEPEDGLIYEVLPAH